MIFKFSLADNGQKTVINFESGPYDGMVPIKSLFIRNGVKHVTPDRLAISCALLMSEFMSSDVTFAKPCSPEVAREIENFFAPLNVRATNTEFRPKPKPISARTAALLLPYPHNDGGAQDSGADVHFGISDQQAFSSHLSMSKILIGCNLRVLARSKKSAALGVLGLCILFSEDFGISRIILPEVISQDVANLDALRRLTLHSNIELVTSPK